MTEEKKSGKKEALRAVKFALFSASAGIIELVSFTLLDLITPWPYWPKYLIALVLSVLWNFTLNRTFTFQSANNVPVAMLKVAAFYAVFTPGVNFVTEFLYDRFIVFGKTLDTNERAKRKESA